MVVQFRDRWSERFSRWMVAPFFDGWLSLSTRWIVGPFLEGWLFLSVWWVAVLSTRRLVVLFPGIWLYLSTRRIVVSFPDKWSDLSSQSMVLSLPKGYLYISTQWMVVPLPNGWSNQIYDHSLINGSTILWWTLGFIRDGWLYPLNVYTGQNPRRRVVIVKTSQMRTICTLIWRESCLLVYIFASAFILGWCIFVDKHFL